MIMNEYRPCVVKGDKEIYKDCKGEQVRALFHCWSEKFWTIKNPYMIEQYTAGQMSMLFGIVEYEDGTLDEVEPSRIQFLDGKFSQYDFPEKEGIDV